jgi:hypothetical protein
MKIAHRPATATIIPLFLVLHSLPVTLTERKILQWETKISRLLSLPLERPKHLKSFIMELSPF